MVGCMLVRTQLLKQKQISLSFLNYEKACDNDYKVNQKDRMERDQIIQGLSELQV